jgi:hypothetical protein
MRPAEGDIRMSSTGPKLAGLQPIARPLATMVKHDESTRFIKLGRLTAVLRPSRQLQVHAPLTLVGSRDTAQHLQEN